MAVCHAYRPAVMPAPPPSKKSAISVAFQEASCCPSTCAKIVPAGEDRNGSGQSHSGALRARAAQPRRPRPRGLRGTQRPQSRKLSGPAALGRTVERACPKLTLVNHTCLGVKSDAAGSKCHHCLRVMWLRQNCITTAVAISDAFFVEMYHFV